MVRRCIAIILIHSIFIVGASFAAEISISRLDYAIAGQHKKLIVSIDSIVSDISSFDLTIAYDQSSTFVYAVRPGSIFEVCGWEYFTYRHITRDTLATYLPGFPVHLINMKGLATLNGNPVPGCNEESTTLVELGLLFTREFPSEEQFLPFRFFWRDCSDNILVSRTGDSVYSAQGLFENRSSTQAHVPFNPAFPGYGFPQTACPAQQYASIVSKLDFVNSGIWAIDVDSGMGCNAGDVNLNGIPYEIADVIEFINFFYWGICGFSCCWGGPPCEAMIAQTDCNCDGLVLSVGDLVCFIRKAIGDDRFHAKAVSGGSYVNMTYDRISNFKSVNLESAADVALAYIRIYPKGIEKLESGDFRFEQSASRTGQIGDTITMMLVNLEGNPVLSAGEHQLFEYSGNSEFEIEAWVVDMSGQESAMKFESGVLPESPELLQNYPNPFNPSTTIEFSLPSNTDWKLEIYNVTGQLIRNFAGTTSGVTKVEWDGTNIDGVEVASGVYFYKLVSSDVTTSRKMLLLK